MFKMIGGDGQEYGPVSAAQLKEWVAENRANGDTKVLPEGSADWTTLSALPEFAEALAAAAPPVLPAPAAMEATESPSRKGEGDRVTPEAGDFDVADCLGHGWLLLRQHFFLLTGATALVWVILTAGAFATCVGALISLVIAGALHGGLMLLCLRLIRREDASMTDLFAGFGPQFMPLMLIWIVTHLLIGIGMFCCVLPGVFLRVIWSFGLTAAIDRGLGFGPALEWSRRATTRHWFKVAALLFVAFLPVIVFTGYTGYQSAIYFWDNFGPIQTWKAEAILQRMKEVSSFMAKLELQQQVVLLLNLPFATAALMHAYEGLSGHRRQEDAR